MSPVKAMEHSITQADGNCTLTTGTAALMTDIVVYKVPRHTAILLRPEDVFAAYLKDASAEALVTDTFKLLVRDPNSLSEELLATGGYNRIKTFDDRNKTLKLGLTKLVKSDFQIVVQAKCATVLVVANCYWLLTCLRYAETL
jgi:hypothetical protein